MISVEFTGQELHALGRKIPATCVVRNELNGWREADQIVRTRGQTSPRGLAYMPRPFPPGQWEITRVATMQRDSVYWPVWIDTNAHAVLPEWEIEHGLYKRATDRHFIGRGYGIHHARYRRADGRLAPSGTTLGCINVLSPDDATWLADEIHDAMGMRQHVFLIVPPWSEWQS